MNDPTSPRSATLAYATLLGATRLLTAQCDVFKLWYSRRAYERSRGEMITMLYEKTLNRKILGAKQVKNKEEVSSTSTVENDVATSLPPVVAVDTQQEPDELRVSSQTSFQKAWSYMRGILSKGPIQQRVAEDDGTASAGKILNLMRYVRRIKGTTIGLILS